MPLAAGCLWLRQLLLCKRRKGSWKPVIWSDAWANCQDSGGERAKKETSPKCDIISTIQDDLQYVVYVWDMCQFESVYGPDMADFLGVYQQRLTHKDSVTRLPAASQEHLAILRLHHQRIPVATASTAWRSGDPWAALWGRGRGFTNGELMGHVLTILTNLTFNLTMKKWRCWQKFLVASPSMARTIT